MTSRSQISASLADEVVILGLHDGVYYGLGRVGIFIWELLKQERTVGDICDRVTAEYEIERDRCERDVLDILEELKERQLIAVRF